VRWTSDGIRVVPPEFPIGSWHSSGLNPDKEYGRKLLRHLTLSSLHGPGDPGLMAIGESEYFIRTMWEPDFGSGALPDSSVARPIVQAHDAGDYVAAWNVDDEPDINGKPLAHELIRNQTYWEHGLTKPSYVNLASQKHFNRFGWFTDIVAMDHYSAPAPPNIIPNTWIPTVGRVGELQEAGEYTWMLKVNSEPRRMHSWCQLAAGVWYQQPTPEAVNYQFWSHILHGAKGIEFFTAQSDLPVENPALWAEAEQLSEQLAEMRTACLYGEPVPTATNVVSGDVEAHLLAGPDAAVLGVLNGSFSFAFNATTMRWDASYAPQSYQVEVTLPAWLSPVQFWYITAGSRLNASSWFTSLGANRYRLAPPINLDGDSHVFLLLNAVDTEVPVAPTGANIPEFIDLANYTLSWSEPHDNVGVSNYRLSWNGSLVDVVAWPVYDVVDGDYNCVTGNWSIEAVDWAGNIGPAAFVPITISIGPPSLTSSPADASVSDGGVVQFGVGATGDGLHYSWEMSTNGGLTWAPVPMAAPYSGTDADTLTISPAALALDSNLYRCMVSNPCGDVITSADALLEVTPLITTSPSSSRVELHPNPASEAIHLRVFGDAQLSSLRITDLMGRICLGPLAAEGQMVELPVGGLPQGGYLLEVVLGDGKVMFERFCVVR
jgi:hypothetical protein